MVNLKDAISQARTKSLDLTFFTKDCEFKASTKNSNVGVRVTTASGKVVTFWSSNADEVVELIDEKTGQYSVMEGTRIADDGGLIPASAKSGGFWK